MIHKLFNFFNKNTERLSFIIILIIAFSLTIFNLGKQSFGLDESFSILISKNFTTLTNILWNSESNMWLYYLILHFWLYLGSDEFTVRFLSVIFSMVSVYFVYKIAKKLYNTNVAIYTVFFTSINVFFIFYAQEARSYSLMLMLSCISSYLYLNITKDKIHRATYIIFSVLAVYAHFYSALILLGHFVYTIYQKNTKKLLPVFLFILFLLLPIVIAPSISSHQVDWISKPSITSLLGTMFVQYGDYPILILIYAILVLEFIYKLLLRKINTNSAVFLFCISILIFVLTFIFSLTVKPIYQSVYFIMSLPALLILASVGYDQIKNKFIRLIIFTSIMIFSLIRLTLWYSESIDSKLIITNETDNWRSAANYINKNIKSDDKVIFYGYFAKTPFLIYGLNSGNIVEIATGEYSLGGGLDLPEPNTNLISQFQYPRIWLVLNRDKGNIKKVTQSSEIRHALLLNYNLTDVNNFYGVNIEKYESK
jgi:mannosyltransferase